MSRVERPKYTQLAKATEMIYAFPGQLMVGWEAQPAGDDAFLVKRKNGTTRLVHLHQPMKTEDGNKIPTLHESGVLMIGEWSVVIGCDVNLEMHARKRGKPKTYLLLGQNNKNLGDVELGKKKDGKDISLIDGHLLKVGEDVIPILPKQKDIQLIVMDKDVDNGKLAYINVIVPGEKDNRENGAPGVFLQPKRSGEPAEFIEVVGEQKVVTALFHISPKGNRIDYKFRDGATAVLVNMLLKKQQECKDMAISVGIDPDEYHEYVEVTKKLTETQNKWQKGSMVLNVGPEMFKPRTMQNSYGGPQP